MKCNQLEVTCFNMMRTIWDQCSNSDKALNLLQDLLNVQGDSFVRLLVICCCEKLLQLLPLSFYLKEYLAQKGFVHRDLAARNVLVGNNKSCKISDFGLTRFVYEEKMYMGRQNRKLPIKWMSIEAIFDQVFTTFSDV